MAAIISADPFECRLWDLHDRLEDLITEDSCVDEIQSFIQHGQLVPVLGRPLRGDATHKYELIFGARRLFVARHLNLPLSVELREISDRNGIIAMDIENRQRTDISPYERGLSYARWLKSGHFNSQDELARILKVSPSQVSRLLGLAKLPAAVVAAFSHPSEIREGWGLELLDVLGDPERRQLLLNQARSLSRGARLRQGRQVYRKLMAAAQVDPILPRSRDEVVTDAGGELIYRIQHKSKCVAIQLPLNRTSASALKIIRATLTKILTSPERRNDSLVDAAVEACHFESDGRQISPQDVADS
jgi:ParB family transcriptional regulator, chromosome partitioning protein